MTVNYFVNRFSDYLTCDYDFMFHFYDINRMPMFLTYKSDIISEYRFYLYANMIRYPVISLFQSAVVDFYVDGTMVRIYTDFDPSLTICELNSDEMK